MAKSGSIQSEHGMDCTCMAPNEQKDSDCPVHGTGRGNVFEPKRRLGPPCTCGAEQAEPAIPHGPECAFEIVRAKLAELFDSGHITQEVAASRLEDWEELYPNIRKVVDSLYADPGDEDLNERTPVQEVEVGKAVLHIEKGESVDIWLWRTLIPDVDAPGIRSTPQFASITLYPEQIALLNTQAPIPPGYTPGNWAIHDPERKLTFEDSKPD